MSNEWSETFASALSCDRPLNAQTVTTQDGVLDRHVNAMREAARKQVAGFGPRYRCAHAVPSDDGKEFESSIHYRNRQRRSILGAVNQRPISLMVAAGCQVRRKSLSPSVKKLRQEIKGRLRSLATGFFTTRSEMEGPK